ncbi:MAG: M43 family zinc metalloprotease [Lacibacter sp.]
MKSLKFLFFFSLVITYVLPVTAQKQKNNSSVRSSSTHRCGTEIVMEELFRKYPAFKKEMEISRAKKFQAQQQLRIPLRIEATYTIPVVVHIVLPSPSTVSDAQVQSQIDALNEDYGGTNADSSRIPAAFKPVFGKSNIRFCLARRDPKGDATNGINRVSSAVISNPGLGDPVKFTCTGGSDAWNPSKYLNIWVCQMPSGFLGYSFFASDPLSFIPLNERGFINNYRSFGRTGTAQAPFNKGKTATHEIGHFFDLEHIWGPNNCDGTQSCSDDDGVNDTPPQLSCTTGAPAADSVIKDACSPSAPGIMWMNYMDYVDDIAMVMFSKQQCTAMETSLLNTTWMQGLATSDGCTPPAALNRDVRFEKFIDQSLINCGTNNTLVYTCSNTYKPVITVKNVGTDNITALTISAKFGNGTPVVTNWSGTIAPQSTTDITLNQITVNAGTNNNLIVYTSNPNGNTDQKVSNDTGKLGAVIYPIVTTPYSEGFETVSFPPSNWKRTNPDGDLTWERTTLASKTGTASMVIKNFDYSSNNEKDELFSPLIPVRGKDSVFLTFQVAAATYNAPDLQDNPTDTLEVLLTKDCGVTFTSVYKKWGADLVTTGNTGVDTSYIPIPSQWRMDTAFLGDYSLSTTENIQAVIRNTTNYENNIYIDDINISIKVVNANLKRNGVMITPNPSRGKFVLQYYERPLNLEVINVYNYAGQLVWQKKVSLGIPGNNYGPNYMEIDLSHFSSGLYTAQLIYRSKDSQTIKILKVN